MAPPGGRTCSSAWSRADRADVLMRDRWNKVIYKCSNDGGSVDGLTDVKANPESLQLHTGTKRQRDKEDRTVNRTFDKSTTALQGQTIKVTYPLKKKVVKIVMKKHPQCEQRWSLNPAESCYTLSKCVNVSIEGQCNRKLCSTVDLLDSLVAELLHFLKITTTTFHLRCNAEAAAQTWRIKTKTRE